MEVTTETGAKRMKRMWSKRSVFHGTVIQSRPEGKWRVHWDECDKLSDHRCSHLKYISAPLEQFDLNLIPLWSQSYIGDHAAMLAWTGKGVKETSNNSSSMRTTDELTLNHLHTNAPQKVPPPPQQQQCNSNNHTEDTPEALSTDSQETTTAHINTQGEQMQSTNEEPSPSAADENVFLSTEGDPDKDMDEVLIYEREIEAELRNQQNTNAHTILLAMYQREKKSMLGKEIAVKGPGQLNTTWTVVQDIKASDVKPLRQFNRNLGITGFEFGPNGRTVKDKRGKNCQINFMDLFRHLWPANEQDQLKIMNEQLRLESKQRSRASRQAKSKPITLREYYTFFGLMIANRTISDRQGEAMWSNKGNEDTRMRSTVTAFNPSQ